MKEELIDWYINKGYERDFILNLNTWKHGGLSFSHWEPLITELKLKMNVLGSSLRHLLEWRFLRGDQWVGLYHWFPRSLTLQLWVLVFYAEVVFSYKWNSNKHSSFTKNIIFCCVFLRSHNAGRPRPRHFFIPGLDNTRPFMSFTAGAGTRCMSLLSSSPNLFWIRYKMNQE